MENISVKEAPIVITGASGRVGSLVANALLAKGHKIRIVARDIAKVKELKERGAEIKIGSFKDAAFMTDVFTGARSAFVLTPINLTAMNVNDEQSLNIHGIIKGIKNSGISNIVLLSSWGTELTEKSGGIMGCRLFENMLDGIPGINTVFLRPVWFMENFLFNLELIKMAGINGLAIKPEVKFPMIATCDIAATATEYLEDLSFKGRAVHYLSGPKEYSMIEVTHILGASIGKPKMKYKEFPASVLKKALVDSGKLSPDGADMLIEINRCLSTGILKPERRSKKNTTATKLEEFAKTQFAPSYNSMSEASFKNRLTGFFLRSFLSVAGNRMLEKERLQYAY